MPAGRGLMLLNRIESYPTACSFLNIFPPSPASCGDILTFIVKVENTRTPAIIPDGYVSVIDVNTGNNLGTATLDPATGTAVIINTNSSGNLALMVKYNGYVDHDGYAITQQFSASQSSITSYNINLLSTTTIITSPASMDQYCPVQDFPVECFISYPGDPSLHPTDGYVQFLLWVDATTYIVLPYAAVNGLGYASSSIPANTTGATPTMADGYFLQAIFMGSQTGCFAGSNTSGGISGLKVIPYGNDPVTVALSISPPPGGICFNESITATVSVTPSALPAPSVGTVDVYDQDTDAVVGSALVSNGTAYVTVDGYLFPEAVSYPNAFTLRARYHDGYSCYEDGYSPDAPLVQLTIKKKQATLNTPTTGIYDACASSAFVFSCDISDVSGSGSLDGYFRFDLYRSDAPKIFVTSFGLQTIATGAPVTVNGTILPNTMSFPHSYYVVGIYVPSGANCYDTAVVISAQSSTISPANC